jgi:flagellar protein FliS
MASMSNAIATTAYLESQVLTASPERLHLMVVDTALRSALAGRTALSNEDRFIAHNALSRAAACVAEILSGIRSEPNPQLADNLRSMFLYAHQSLLLADQNRDVSAVNEAIRMLEHHRETWLGLMQQLQPAPGSVSAGTTPGESAASSAATRTAAPDLTGAIHHDRLATPQSTRVWDT